MLNNFSDNCEQCGQNKIVHKVPMVLFLIQYRMHACHFRLNFISTCVESYCQRTPHKKYWRRFRFFIRRPLENLSPRTCRQISECLTSIIVLRSIRKHHCHVQHTIGALNSFIMPNRFIRLRIANVQLPNVKCTILKQINDLTSALLQPLLCFYFPTEKF